MKLSKTAQALLNDMQNGNGMLSVEYGFQYRKEFGMRNMKAAEELVKAGIIERTATHPFRELVNGNVRMHGLQVVFKLK